MIQRKIRERVFQKYKANVKSKFLNGRGRWCLHGTARRPEWPEEGHPCCGRRLGNL